MKTTEKQRTEGTVTPASAAGGVARTTHPLILPPNLGGLAKLAGDDTRFALSAVHVAGGPDGYRVAATDGKALAVVTGQAADAGEYPELPALTSAPNGEREALVPARD